MLWFEITITIHKRTELSDKTALYQGSRLVTSKILFRNPATDASGEPCEERATRSVRWKKRELPWLIRTHTLSPDQAWSRWKPIIYDGVLQTAVTVVGAMSFQSGSLYSWRWWHRMISGQLVDKHIILHAWAFARCSFFHMLHALSAGTLQQPDRLFSVCSQLATVTSSPRRFRWIINHFAL